MINEISHSLVHRVYTHHLEGSIDEIRSYLKDQEEIIFPDDGKTKQRSFYNCLKLKVEAFNSNFDEPKVIYFKIFSNKGLGGTKKPGTMIVHGHPDFIDHGICILQKAFISNNSKPLELYYKKTSLVVTYMRLDNMSPEKFQKYRILDQLFADLNVNLKCINSHSIQIKIKKGDRIKSILLFNNGKSLIHTNSYKEIDLVIDFLRLIDQRIDRLVQNDVNKDDESMNINQLLKTLVSIMQFIMIMYILYILLIS